MNEENKYDVKFNKWFCNVELHQYGNRRLCIKLTNAVDDHENDSYAGEPIATATTNVPEININENEVIIKNYSENEGMFEAMEKAGYVSSFRLGQTGHVEVYIAEKTDKLKELEKLTFSENKKLKM